MLVGQHTSNVEFLNKEINTHVQFIVSLGVFLKQQDQIILQYALLLYRVWEYMARNERM